MTVTRGWVIGPVVLATIAAALTGLAIWGPSSSEVNLSVVLGAGFIDGLNPCAIAVLMIFIAAMMAAVERASRGGDAARRYLLVGGGSYITGMYITYFTLGVGLLGAVAFLQETHLVGRLAALVAISLGLLSLQEGLVPEWGQRLFMPAMFPGTANRLAPRGAPPGPLGA